MVSKSQDFTVHVAETGNLWEGSSVDLESLVDDKNIFEDPAVAGYYAVYIKKQSTNVEIILTLQ